MSLTELLNYIEMKYVISLCIIAIFCYFAFNSTKKPRNFPPGPRGFPFLGIVPLVGRRPEITFMNWSKKYGDVIGLKMGSNYAVVLNSYDAIQEALVKNAKVFNNRPDNYLFTEILKKKGIAFDDYTPEYIDRRNFAHAALNRVGIGKTSFEGPIADEAKHLLVEFGDGDVEINAETLAKIMQATANTIAQITIGKRYSDYQDPEFQTILKGVGGFMQAGATAYLASVVFPRFLCVPPIRGIMMRIKTGLDNFFTVINKKIANHEKMVDVAEKTDFIEEHLAEMNKNSDLARAISKDTLRNSIRDLFGAALDGVELIFGFSCLVLANRPNLMKRIHDEIDDVIDFGEKPRYELRDQMPFCQAFIMEIMRYRTVAPFGIAHCTSENIKFMGYNIPKGTTVFSNFYAVHNDPQNWEEPEKFNPERHLDSDGNVIISKYFIPYGCGPRLCIGLGLAKMELFIFFVTIFQQYSAKPTPASSCKFPYVQDDGNWTGMTLLLPENIPVTLVRRKFE